MAAKRIDPLKAKEAKQKKIAIAGFVLLLALLAFQGPKTLKMLKGPQPVASAASTSPTTTTPAPVVPAVGADPAATPVAAAAPELSAVADSDAAPAAEQGQLATFERFASKDPFAQQAEPVEVTPPAAAAPEDGTDKTATADDKTADGEKPAGEEGASDGGFTTGGSTDAKPEIATATSISVNGVAEDVILAATFPKEEPTFVLVSIATDGKSVQIGIAGGEYATGGETMKLALGKKITLQNTADGSRYEIELLTIQGFAVPRTKT
jgi:hypothetical protein